MNFSFLTYRWLTVWFSLVQCGAVNILHQLAIIMSSYGEITKFSIYLHPSSWKLNHNTEHNEWKEKLQCSQARINATTVILIHIEVKMQSLIFPVVGFHFIVFIFYFLFMCFACVKFFFPVYFLPFFRINQFRTVCFVLFVLFSSFFFPIHKYQMDVVYCAFETLCNI